MAVLLAVFAAICMAVNFVTAYLIVSFFVIYLALGIFCTIKNDVNLDIFLRKKLLKFHKF